MLSEKQLALATRALWSLQEAAISIDGLLLAQTSGLTITSTMQGDDSTQRIAAVSATLFRLCEFASDLWSRGEAQEISLKLRDNNQLTHIMMLPVGWQAMLMVIANQNTAQLWLQLREAAAYLDEVLTGHSPLIPDWHL